MLNIPGLQFDLGEDIAMLRETLQQFTAAEITPHAGEIDRNDQFPMALWRKFGELGVLGMTVPEEYGGTDMGYLAHVVAMEDQTQGEHVRRFVIEAVLTHGGPAGTIQLWEGQNLGHKQICPFSQLQVRQIRLRVTQADGPVSLRALELHKTR